MYKYNKELFKFIPPKFNLDNYANTAQFVSEDWNVAFLMRDTVEEYLLQGQIDRAKHRSSLNIRMGAAESIRYIKFSGGTGVEDFDQESYDLHQQGTEGSNCFAKVELKMPDNLLVKAFSEWVKNKRFERDVKATNNKITSAKSRQWNEARILQYLDVTQWHRINDLKPTQEQVGLIIYPDDNRGAVDERLKTIKKHITHLKTKGFKNALSVTPPKINRNESL